MTDCNCGSSDDWHRAYCPAAYDWRKDICECGHGILFHRECKFGCVGLLPEEPCPCHVFRVVTTKEPSHAK